MRGLHAGWLASLPEPARNILAALSPGEARALLYDWSFWARPTQLPPPGDWRVWLLLAGRGFGKTRTGAELIRARVAALTARRLALVAPTAADARNVIVEGESGLLAVSPPWDRPRYEPSKRRLTWPKGCDELGSWRYPEAWDMLMFGLRLVDDPRVVVTTTPRPTKLIRALIADPTAVVTRGSTYENRANLAPAFLDQIIRKYEGTRLGRQELEAELLDDVPGALWTRGIIVAGKDEQGQGWVLADMSGRYPPTEWAKTAIAAYRAHRADRVVAEVNHGGEMVEATLRAIDSNVPFSAVRASRGKVTRAEPVAALYEQGRVHHVGSFPQLEDQMCDFVPTGYDDVGLRSAGRSPDRVDALVWALTNLLLEPMPNEGIFEYYRQLAEKVRS